jgi:hypothetical protein
MNKDFEGGGRGLIWGCTNESAWSDSKQMKEYVGQDTVSVPDSKVSPLEYKSQVLLL